MLSEMCRWLAKDEGRQDLGLPRVVCEYEDVFPNELSGLHPHRDVDFVIPWYVAHFYYST